METILESYYKMFFKEAYFFHKIIKVEPTEEPMVCQEVENRVLRIYINLN